MKKLFILPVILLLVGVGCSLQNNNQNQNLMEENNAANIVVGGDTDEHGCLGSAGYSWCENTQSCLRVWEEWCADDVNKIVSNIEKEKNIQFTKEDTDEIEWHLDEGVIKLHGNKYYTVGENRELADEIFSYFDDYQLDVYNLADGMNGSLIGFTKDYTACTLLYTLPYAFEENEKSKIVETTLECGLYNPNTMKAKTTEDHITQLFVDKYNKDASLVKVNIDQKVDDYVRGMVNFLQENGEPAEGGIFLANKVDENWRLVFDGNGGIDCNLLTGQNFPEDMMSDCYWPENDEQNNSTDINNFKDCVDAGNPVMESYPRQCQHKDMIFTEEKREGT